MVPDSSSAARGRNDSVQSHSTAKPAKIPSFRTYSADDDSLSLGIGIVGELFFPTVP